MAIRLRAGRAGMQNLADADFSVRHHQLSALPGERADANQPFRFEDLQHPLQMFVADGKQFFPLGLGQFVRREVRPAGRQEGERTVIGDKMSGEGFFRRAKSLRKQFPETA